MNSMLLNFVYLFRAQFYKIDVFSLVLFYYIYNWNQAIQSYSFLNNICWIINWVSDENEGHVAEKMTLYRTSIFKFYN